MITIHEYMTKSLKKSFILWIKEEKSGRMITYNRKIDMKTKKDEIGINLIHSVNQKDSKSDII